MCDDDDDEDLKTQKSEKETGIMAKNDWTVNQTHVHQVGSSVDEDGSGGDVLWHQKSSTLFVEE